MDPSPPTVPAIQQERQLSPPQPCEEEAAESLLLLQEASDPKVEGAFQESDLEGELHPIGDESTMAASFEALPCSSSGQVQVTMDAEIEQAAGTVMMLDVCLSTEFRAQATIEEEYAPPAPIEGRRCRRNNGRGWWCSELARPGYTMCWQHTLNRRENFEKLRAKKAQASSGSGAIVPGIEGSTTTAATDENDAASSIVSGTVDDSDRELQQ